MILVESVAMKGQSKQKGNCTFFSLMQTLKTQGQLSSGHLKLTGIDGITNKFNRSSWILFSPAVSLR